MEIEVGKTYRTRDQGTATIEKMDASATLYPYYGEVIDGKGRVIVMGTWSIGGRFNVSAHSIHDLMYEI